MSIVRLCVVQPSNCTGIEVRCKDCGIYINKCGCGYNNGLSARAYKKRIVEECRKNGSRKGKK